MYQIDFNKPCHVHFIGIGGISMSGFAILLKEKGFTVSGSDTAESTITDHLEELGIRVQYGQTAGHITGELDLIVYTAAISASNPEYCAAVASGIPMMDRAEMVGQVMKNYSNSIAVSGTHGKTTTTSMLSHIFLANDMDPTISVGGILNAIHGNIRIGRSEHFITEACEYTNSFLKFHPTTGIILNIDADHLDFFKDLDDIRHSFHEFALLLPADGLLVLNGEIAKQEELLRDVRARVVTYGYDKDYAKGGSDKSCASAGTAPSSPVPQTLPYDYYASNITFDENGYGAFDVYARTQTDAAGEEGSSLLGRIHLNVVGEHNISNAMAAVAVALEAKSISFEMIRKGLAEFKGTNRRFEYKGNLGGITIIDDYAHHPTEITATLTAAQKYPHKTLWCLFQPHTYSRTRSLLKEFAQALTLADKVILADIYAAREKDPGDISSVTLQQELAKLGKEVYYFPSFGEIEDFILTNCEKDDLLITMGAGNVVEIGEFLLGQ